MRDAVDQNLSEQLDIVEIIRWFRVFKLVAMLSLTKNQAKLVNHFGQYCLNSNDLDIQSIKANQKNDPNLRANSYKDTDELMEDFKP